MDAVSRKAAQRAARIALRKREKEQKLAMRDSPASYRDASEQPIMSHARKIRAIKLDEAEVLVQKKLDEQFKKKIEEKVLKDFHQEQKGQERMLSSLGEIRASMNERRNRLLRRKRRYRQFLLSTHSRPDYIDYGYGTYNDELDDDDDDDDDNDDNENFEDRSMDYVTPSRGLAYSLDGLQSFDVAGPISYSFDMLDETPRQFSFHQDLQTSYSLDLNDFQPATTFSFQNDFALPKSIEFSFDVQPIKSFDSLDLNPSQQAAVDNKLSPLDRCREIVAEFTKLFELFEHRFCTKADFEQRRAELNAKYDTGIEELDDLHPFATQIAVEENVASNASAKPEDGVKEGSQNDGSSRVPSANKKKKKNKPKKPLQSARVPEQVEVNPSGDWGANSSPSSTPREARPPREPRAPPESRRPREVRVREPRSDRPAPTPQQIREDLIFRSRESQLRLDECIQFLEELQDKYRPYREYDSAYDDTDLENEVVVARMARRRYRRANKRIIFQKHIISDFQSIGVDPPVTWGDIPSCIDTLIQKIDDLQAQIDGRPEPEVPAPPVVEEQEVREYGIPDAPVEEETFKIDKVEDDTFVIPIQPGASTEDAEENESSAKNDGASEHVSEAQSGLDDRSSARSFSASETMSVQSAVEPEEDYNTEDEFADLFD